MRAALRCVTWELRDAEEKSLHQSMEINVLNENHSR